MSIGILARIIPGLRQFDKYAQLRHTRNYVKEVKGARGETQETR